MKKRILETNQGIQGEFDVKLYDQMQRHLRDKGWIETDSIIKYGITTGLALEIGPGPGYLGLEWLKKTTNTNLKCIEISQNMIRIAEKNANDYGFINRVEYKEGTAEEISFDDSMFDAVFTNGSLHEWSSPLDSFNEIHRVLKVGGKFFISDLKRNMNPLMVWFIKTNSKPKEIRPGFISSINAAYIKNEIIEIINQSKLKGAVVSENLIGIAIKGVKQ